MCHLLSRPHQVQDGDARQGHCGSVHAPRVRHRRCQWSQSIPQRQKVIGMFVFETHPSTCNLREYVPISRNLCCPRLYVCF